MRRRVLAAFLSFAGMLGCTTLASGATGAETLSGGATWYASPGLSMVPTDQTSSILSMPAAGVGVNGTSHSGLVTSCTFNGASTAPETLLEGSGTLSGACSGAMNVNCGQFQYQRDGLAMTFSSQGSVCGVSMSDGATFTAQISGGCTLTEPQDVYGQWPPAYPFLTIKQLAAACQLDFI